LSSTIRTHLRTGTGVEPASAGNSAGFAICSTFRRPVAKPARDTVKQS
jgi:hypothetical protein